MKTTLKSNKNPDTLNLKLEELDQIYNVSIDLLKKTQDPDGLLDALLEEYIRRFSEIPGTRLVADLSTYADTQQREKVHALLLYAELAALLKENSDIQDRLKEKNQNLIELTAKKETANRELRELNAHYLNMLGFVSHELRSPLISILGFAELLEEGYLGELNVEQLNSVQIIIRVTRNLIEMIRNYLDLAKMESGELIMNWQYFDVCENIIEPLMKELEGLLIVRGMQIQPKENEIARNILIHGDTELIKIVFTNLFGNAIKYGRSETSIRYNFLDFGNNYYFSIQNEGEGVPKDKINSIFSKFSQTVHYDPDVQKGTGLGLFNTQCIIKAHGGKIWAESEIKKWFKVCFTLPKQPVEMPKIVKIPSRLPQQYKIVETIEEVEA